MENQNTLPGAPVTEEKTVRGNKRKRNESKTSSDSSTTTEELFEQLSIDQRSIDSVQFAPTPIDNSIEDCPVLSPCSPTLPGEPLMEHEKFDNYVEYLQKRTGLTGSSPENDPEPIFPPPVDPQPSTSFDLPEMSLFDLAAEETVGTSYSQLPPHLCVNVDDVTTKPEKKSLKSKLKKSYLTKTLDNLKKRVVNAISSTFEEDEPAPSTSKSEQEKKVNKGGRPTKIARGCKSKEKEAAKALKKEYDLVRNGVLPNMELKKQNILKFFPEDANILEVCCDVLRYLVYEVVQPPILPEKKKRHKKVFEPPIFQRTLRDRRSKE